MAYPIQCPCGRTIEVTAGMAGGEVACPCGTVLAVPGLGQLRRQAGQEAYVTNAVERVRKMLAAGEIPPGELCAGCGAPTADVLQCEAVCEKSWSRRMAGDSGREFGGFLAFLLLPGGLFRRKVRTERHGRDVSVTLPLRVCRSCRKDVGPGHRRRLVEWLRTVPGYDDLFREYPDLDLRIVTH